MSDDEIEKLIDECYNDPNLKNDVAKRLLLAILKQVWRPRYSRLRVLPGGGIIEESSRHAGGPFTSHEEDDGA